MSIELYSCAIKSSNLSNTVMIDDVLSPTDDKLVIHKKFLNIEF
ncbi:MAG: hypothetical protein QW356_09195 [Candidatus Hadarchaeales archaeon]